MLKYLFWFIWLPYDFVWKFFTTYKIEFTAEHKQIIWGFICLVVLLGGGITAFVYLVKGIYLWCLFWVWITGALGYPAILRKLYWNRKYDKKENREYRERRPV